MKQAMENKRAGTAVLKGKSRCKDRRNSCASRPGLFSDEAGITMLQFAVAFPVLMVILLAVIDVTRIYSVKALLQTGAEDGLSTALAIPNLNIDSRSLDPANSSETYDYYRYQWAKNHVMNSAERVPMSTLVGDFGSGNWAEIVKFQHSDSQLVTNAAVLRPFECARAVSGDPDGCADGETGCFRHPALAAGTDCNSYLGSDPDTLKREPVVVAMRAKVKTILPLFNNLEVEGIARGFRPDIPLADVDLSEVLGDPEEPDEDPDPLPDPDDPNPDVDEDPEDPVVIDACLAPELQHFVNTCRVGTTFAPAGEVEPNGPGRCCCMRPNGSNSCQTL